jgi:hypothetical protein
MSERSVGFAAPAGLLYGVSDSWYRRTERLFVSVNGWKAFYCHRPDLEGTWLQAPMWRDVIKRQAAITLIRAALG